MPVYLDYAISVTQAVLAGVIMVAVGFTLWDMGAPPGRCDDDDPQWYRDWMEVHDED